MKAVAVGVCVTGLLMGAVVTAPSAGAADGTVRPSHARLLDAAGNDSGCEVRALDAYVYEDSEGEARLVTNVTKFRCDKGYGKRVWRDVLFEILPDGTRATIRPMSERARGGPVQPGVVGRGYTDQPCSLFPGTHTFVSRAKAKVKVDRLSTNPFSATVEKATTVVCPS